MAEWRDVLMSRGLNRLSPPEAAHVLLELPAERAAYTALVGELTGWPERSPLTRRVPDDDEIRALNAKPGRWRAICLLDDARALRTAALLFQRVFALDPMYDSGDLLYAAWHDPTVKVEHARRLAEQAALLVSAWPLLRDGAALLAPDHLPGSWDPQPGWRRPPADADAHLQQAWTLRTALVLLNWADRLDAVIVTAHTDLAAQIGVALGRDPECCTVALPDAPELEEIVSCRTGPTASTMKSHWASARRLARARQAKRLQILGCTLAALAALPAEPARPTDWQLRMGVDHIADPALLLRRVLSRQDPHRPPPLPRVPLRRRSLCLLTDDRRAVGNGRS